LRSEEAKERQTMKKKYGVRVGYAQLKERKEEKKKGANSVPKVGNDNLKHVNRNRLKKTGGGAPCKRV